MAIKVLLPIGPSETVKHLRDDGEDQLSDIEQPPTRRCQRVIDGDRGRGQCPRDATWRGSLHAAREIYVVESCDQHKSGLVDAEPLDGNW